MRAYLAGASAEIETCEHFRDLLIAAGHTITHDWMRVVRSVGAANGPSVPDEIAIKEVNADIRGVLDEEAFKYIDELK